MQVLPTPSNKPAALKALKASKLVENIYLDTLRREVPQWKFDGRNREVYRRFDLRDVRSEMTRAYSWAIPNDEALLAIAQYSPIVEIGAGTGYWAWLLQQMGVTVYAYDIATGKANGWHGNRPRWTAVNKGGSGAVQKHLDCALLLCWPPYDTNMAYNALSRYGGSTLIYIGEGYGGYTGNDRFFEYLDRHFNPVKEVTIPTWEGMHDRLEIYTRKVQRGTKPKG